MPRLSCCGMNTRTATSPARGASDTSPQDHANRCTRRSPIAGHRGAERGRYHDQRRELTHEPPREDPPDMAPNRFHRASHQRQHAECPITGWLDAWTVRRACQGPGHCALPASPSTPVAARRSFCFRRATHLLMRRSFTAHQVTNLGAAFAPSCHRACHAASCHRRSSSSRSAWRPCPL